MQISMPELSEDGTKNWDELNYIPLVAVLPLNFDENISEIITAYDISDTKTELSISVSSKFGEEDDFAVSTSLKVTISAKDDEAGESVVEYKDETSGEGTEYNTGIVKFWINQ
ncbi:MAG: hypothetical protein J7J72_02980 [Bacteroidales bacterium]|nr:hypothetical protein [Bacteroidales bacterium]